MDVPDSYSVKHLDHHTYRILPIDTVFYPDTLNKKIFSGDTIYLSDIYNNIVSIDTLSKIIYDTLYLVDTLSDSILDTIVDSIFAIDTTISFDTLFADNSFLDVDIDYIYPDLSSELNVRSDLDNPVRAFIHLNVGDSITIQINDTGINNSTLYITKNFMPDSAIFIPNNNYDYYLSGNLLQIGTKESFIKIKALSESKGLISFARKYSNEIEYLLPFCFSPLDSISLRLDSIDLGYYLNLDTEDTTKAYNWIRLNGSSNAYSITVMLGVQVNENSNIKYYERYSIINKKSAQSSFEFTFRLEDDLMPNELNKSIKSVRLILRGTLGYDQELLIPIPE